MIDPIEQIPDEDKSQYQILLNCAANENTLLSRVYDKKSKSWITTLCGFHREDDGTHQIWPIAKMLTAEDMKYLEPPTKGKP